MAGLPLRASPRGVLLMVRATPRGGAARIDGLGVDANDRSFVKLRVKEPPEKGKANEGVIRLLSSSLKIPASRFEIVAGDTDRLKTVLVCGDAQVLQIAIEEWLSGLPAA